MLIYHELIHISLSLLAGVLIYLFFRRKILFLFSFLAGVLIDGDHIIDYLIFKKELAFNWAEFTSGYFFEVMGKVFLFLHGYEYVFIFVILGLIIYKLGGKVKNQLAGIFFVISLSMFFHLFFDQYSYRPKILTYSIIYRISQNFDHDRLGFK